MKKDLKKIKDEVSEKMCLNFGGHCWHCTDENMSTTSANFKCKHCGKKARRSYMEWEEFYDK